MKTVCLEILFKYSDNQLATMLKIGKIGQLIGEYSKKRYRIESTWKQSHPYYVYVNIIDFKEGVDVDAFIKALKEIHENILFEVKP